MRGSIVRRSHHWIVNRGWRGFLAELWRRVRIRLSRQRRVGDAKPPVRGRHPFDEQYGVETGGLIFAEKLRADRRKAYWATAYYGISPAVLWAALERLALDWQRYTFVDIGCGKGRALLAATRFPFRGAVGVELSPELAEVARENVARFEAPWRQPMPIEVIAGDATETSLPEGPLVLSLYHPFAAPVMRRFLAQLERKRARDGDEMWILYTNPELDPMLSGVPWLERQWDACLPLPIEEQEANHFGVEWERVVAYRTRS